MYVKILGWRDLGTVVCSTLLDPFLECFPLVWEQEYLLLLSQHAFLQILTHGPDGRRYSILRKFSSLEVYIVDPSPPRVFPSISSRDPPTPFAPP